MLKKVTQILIILLCNTTFANMFTEWHTTKIKYSSGYCTLGYGKLKVKVNGLYLDVIEDAVIKASGTVDSAEASTTIEIQGQFVLPPGSIIKSLLLWNGNKILKAKLLDKTKADQIMDSIVNNTVKDPMLVKLEEQNRYKFRIYPATINEGRKVRMRYSIPLSTLNSTLAFILKPALTTSCINHLETIPVTFKKGTNTFNSYKITQNGVSGDLKFDSTYFINIKDLDPNRYSGRNKNKRDSKNMVYITPEKSIFNNIYSTHIDSGKIKGYYYAAFIKMPDTVKNYTSNNSNLHINKKLVIKYGSSLCVKYLFSNAPNSIYLKTISPWNKKVQWIVTSSSKDTLLTYEEELGTKLKEKSSDHLPNIWGGQYSLVEMKAPLGGLFGFVDDRMSLLALEKDTLSTALEKIYADTGVPYLLEKEILISDKDIEIPFENLIIKNYENINWHLIDDPISIEDQIKNLSKEIKLVIDRFNSLIINISDKICENLFIEIYDLKGRKIKAIKNADLNKKMIKVKIATEAKGAYLVKIRSGDIRLTKKIILK